VAYNKKMENAIRLIKTEIDPEKRKDNDLKQE